MTQEHDTTLATSARDLDPRARILIAAGAAISFSCVRGLAASCLCLALALTLAAARRIPAGFLAKRLALANAFVLFLWLTVPPTMPGESLFRLGPLSWSREGIELAALVTVKCNAILVCIVALTADASLPRLGCALERLGAPAKLVFLFLFTCRYIHVMGAEWRRLQTAAGLRGFVPRNSLHTYRTIGAMLGFTFVNAIDRSRRIYEAMLLRGFEGTFHTVATLRATNGDILFAAFFLVSFCCPLFLDLYSP